MDIQQLHSWSMTPAEAVQLQLQLASRVRITNSFDVAGISLVAGVDVSMTRFNPVFTAGVVVCRADTMEAVERVAAQGEGTFPYIPGLLSFREIPVLTQVLEEVEHVPDVVLVDGQGIAHPRRLGIASHLGLLIGCPTIGVGKSPLVGGKRNPGVQVGDELPLLDKGEEVGRVVRTKVRANPLYISVGNNIDLPTAVAVVQRCLRGYRLPEPTRLAHQYVNEVRRQLVS